MLSCLMFDCKNITCAFKYVPFVYLPLIFQSPDALSLTGNSRSVTKETNETHQPPLLQAALKQPFSRNQSLLSKNRLCRRPPKDDVQQGK